MPRVAKWPFVEKTPNGWRASVRDGAKRIKGAVRETPQEAHGEAVAILEQLKGANAPSAAMTLGEVLEAILRDCERRERRDATGDFYRSHLGAWSRHFGEDKRLASLTVTEVQDFIDERRKAGIGGLTIKHNLMALTRAMRLAGVEPNPAKSLKLIRPKVKKRDLTLRMSWAEVMAMIHRLQALGLMTELAVLGFIAGTGVRRSEFARMKRTDLDLLGERLIIPVGKTEPRELPLARGKGETSNAWQCADLLLGLNEKKGAVFLIPGEDERQRVEWLRQVVDRARAQTGQTKLQLHELRRAFASRVAEKFPVPVVSALLGHALPGVTGLYVHADQKVLRAAMEDVWSDFDGE